MIEGCTIDFVACCLCGREILWKDVEHVSDVSDVYNGVDVLCACI